MTQQELQNKIRDICTYHSDEETSGFRAMKWKKIKSPVVPYCEICETILQLANKNGDENEILPYQCKCGKWEYNSNKHNYVLNKETIIKNETYHSIACMIQQELQNKIRDICTYHSDEETSGYCLSEKQFEEIFELFRQEEQKFLAVLKLWRPYFYRDKINQNDIDELNNLLINN